MSRQATSRRRELSLYDGRDRVGEIVVDDDGKAKAFNAKHKSLGTFASVKRAMRAIGDARRRGLRARP